MFGNSYYYLDYSYFNQPQPIYNPKKNFNKSIKN